MDHCPILRVIRDLQHKVLNILLFPLDIDKIKGGHLAKIDLQPFLGTRIAGSLIGCPARLTISIDCQICRKARVVLDIVGGRCSTQCQIGRGRTRGNGVCIYPHAGSQSEDHAADQHQHGELF